MKLAYPKTFYMNKCRENTIGNIIVIKYTQSKNVISRHKCRTILLPMTDCTNYQIPSSSVRLTTVSTTQYSPYKKFLIEI